MRWLALALGCFAVLGSVSAAAALDIPAVTLTSEASGTQSYGVSIQILAVMTMLTLLPSFVIMLTAFTRIIIVFAIVRQAIGMQTTPSNQILVGLALFLTIFVMAPVLTEVNEVALQPYLTETLAPADALAAAAEPFKSFMLGQTREADLDVFLRLSEHAPIAEPSEVDFFVLVPAFMTSELKTAFQIGFMLFIPFLVIDMVVASVLMSMGMMMLSPLIISLPFKIMLFVLVDGWVLLMGTLATSFGGGDVTPGDVLQLFADALFLVITMVAVIVVPSLLVGLTVSVLQAATQINEQTLSFLPRLIATLVAIMLAGPWLLTQLTEFSTRLIQSIPGFVG